MGAQILSGIGEQLGAVSLDGDGWSARVLPGAPLIAPARMFTFPLAIAGEEDALARGALWVEVRVAGQPAFVAQCARGYATDGVAHGLWRSGGGVLAVAGGYAFAIDPCVPERTALLPLRPVVRVLSVPSLQVAVLVGFHAVFIAADDESWDSMRLSWEGVTLTSCEGDVLYGTGWDMAADEEVPFALNLRTRELQGGGYRG